MGCISQVLLGGRKIKFIAFRFWICGCAGQLSTISAIFLSSSSNFMSSSRTHSSKIILSIQLFDWERYLHGKVPTPLKHRGLADFPITNMGSLSPSASAAAKPVNLTFSGEASGHAVHAEHNQKYSRVKNFFICLKKEVCLEIFFKNRMRR